MSLAITFIAYTFYAIAAAVGAPGAAYLVYEIWRWIRRKLWPKPPRVTRSSARGDGLMEIFNAIDVGLGAISKVGGAVGEIVAGLLAGIALSAVLVGALLFFTARGLMQQDAWARWVAIALLANLGLLAVVSLAVGRRRRPLRVALTILIAATSAFFVRSLWIGY